LSSALCFALDTPCVRTNGDARLSLTSIADIEYDLALICTQEQ
jgi:hypothetical protein